MNDDLEQLLKQQSLRQPTRILDLRIASALRPATFSLAKWLPLTAVIAASLLVAVVLRQPTTKSSQESNPTPVATGDARPVQQAAFAPIEIEQVWSEVTPGNVVLTVDNQPLRPWRISEYRQTRWIDPANNVEIELTVPDEQIVLVSMPLD